MVVWQTTSKHCTKKRAARAARLFFFIQPIKSLICGVVVDVAVVTIIFLSLFSSRLLSFHSIVPHVEVPVRTSAPAFLRCIPQDNNHNEGITSLFSGISFIWARVVSFAARARSFIIINKQGQMISRMRVLIIQAK